MQAQARDWICLQGKHGQVLTFGVTRSMGITVPHTFDDDWDFQSGYYEQIKRIIEWNATQFIRVYVADPDADYKRATDFTVRIDGGDIAVRIRRASQKYRDWTIRSYKGGHKTEIHK